MSDIETKVKAAAATASADWGAFRKYIAAHPLTGAWIGFLAGALAGGLVVYKILPALL